MDSKIKCEEITANPPDWKVCDQQDLPTNKKSLYLSQLPGSNGIQDQFRSKPKFWKPSNFDAESISDTESNRSKRKKVAKKQYLERCSPEEIYEKFVAERIRRDHQRSKSRELRSGFHYTHCDCGKNNGLQHDCRRSECQGCPECTVYPPKCINSSYANPKNFPRHFWQK